MKKRFYSICTFAFLLTVSGCGYGYYLGLHGPTIKSFQDVHEGVTKDADCLECHHPDNAGNDAPATTHPQFSGCLKCHNDDPA